MSMFGCSSFFSSFFLAVSSDRVYQVKEVDHEVLIDIIWLRFGSKHYFFIRIFFLLQVNELFNPISLTHITPV